MAATLAATWAAGSTATASGGDPSGFTAVGGVSQSGAVINTAKSTSGKLAKSDPALLARTDGAEVNVMVKVDVDAVASYKGDVRGLAATSPGRTGKKLKQNAKAVSAYSAYVTKVVDKASKDIAKSVKGATTGKAYVTAYGGLAVRLPANQVKNLLKVPGVVAVQADTLEQPQTDATPAYIGATAVWPSLGGSTKAGEGVIVGVLDTGIWPEHPSFADNGINRPAGGPWGCQFGNGSVAELGAAFACNDKLIGAYAFTNTYLANNVVGADEFCKDNGATGVCSPRDSDGHGTHTASTSAGSAVAHATIFGVDRGAISGIAPGASVIAYRVCLANGCYGSDSVSAVQQAILDGVDVINFSISGGKNPYTDPVELAFLDAFAAGVSVNASAGNSGPGAATTDHGSPWVTTVAASTSNRAFSSTLTLTASNGDVFTKLGSTLTQGVSGLPVVLAANVPGYTGGNICATPFASGSLTGKVVVCQRGGTFGGAAIGRVQKGYNALQGGAAGMILYNPTASDTETDNHFLPAIHLEGPNTALLSYLAGHTGVTATWAAGQKTAQQGDVMAGFSSRGPLGDWLKPDITAPGVQILAGHTPASVDLATGPQGQLFQAIAGTSMSSPHSAGASALVKAAHPTWSPAQIKSALMLGAAQDVVKETGAPSDPFDRGAGGLRVNTAVAQGITLDETAADYAAAAANTLDRVDLNVPSVQVNPLAGIVTTHRTFTNVTTKDQPYKASATTTNGLKVTVTPSSFSVPAGGTYTVTVTVDGTAAGPGWSFGAINLVSTPGRSPNATIPVAALTGNGAVAMTHTCTPTTVRVNAATQCAVSLTNNAPVAAPVDLSLVAPRNATVSNVSAPATATGTTGFAWSGTLSPSLPPTVNSITAGGSPAGYLPLSLFGIAPIGGVGDESIVNFNVPSFKYGGEVYSSLGIDSNGYVVIGGGAGADNDCCTVPPIPNVARPNNVVAPFWTDLDPSAAGAVRIGTLTDGVDTWIVVDYAGVPAFGTTLANSFEVWIQTGNTEGVTIAHGTMNGANGQPTNQGAENRTGTSGATYTGGTDTDWSVNTSPPTAGGSVNITYAAAASRTGTYVLAPTATTPLVKGVISVARGLTVTP
jgi:subtilisin family serine protease